MSAQRADASFVITVVGATGLIGRELIETLYERNFPVSELRLVSSEEEIGQEIFFGEDAIVVQKLSPEVFKGAKFTFFASTSDITKQYAPIAVENGCVVLDNSTAYRLNKDVPLIVAGVNDLALHQSAQKKMISCPNCVVAHLTTALKPIQETFGLKRVVTSTYQSTSGAGAKAMEELSRQVKELFNYRESEMEVFPHRIAFNLIPEIGAFDDEGYSEEELSIVNETLKVLQNPACKISATAVRVPTFHGHAQSVNFQTEKPATKEQLQKLLEETKGVILLDDPKQHIYPIPSESHGQDEVFVGRIRTDPTLENSFHAWIVSDNLRKGAALNAVQIAEMFVENGFV